MNPPDRSREEKKTPGAPAEREPQRRHTSEALLAGSREVIIEHRGEDYRLRLTANGKLILTK